MTETIWPIMPKLLNYLALCRKRSLIMMIALSLDTGTPVKKSSLHKEFGLDTKLAVKQEERKWVRST